MTYIIADNFPHPIIEKNEGPVVSIYLPTSRITTETRENSIRFKNLLKQVEKKLHSDYPGEASEKILADLRTMHDDSNFWSYQLDALGVLASADQTVVYKLQRDVQEYCEVSDTFYVKPLINAYQTDDNFQILALYKDNFALYEGNRYALRKVEIPEDEYKSQADVVGHFYEETHMQGTSVGNTGGVRHGVGGSTRDEEAVDVEKYFRWVDRYIMDHHSKRTEVPLILASVTEHQADFREISHNDYLIEESIKKDPQQLSEETLREMAWQIMEPKYRKTMEETINRYNIARSRELASEDPAEIAMAARDMRIDTLILDINEKMPGKIDRESGKILQTDTSGDVLNDLAFLALRQGAKVYVVSEDEAPIHSSLKAIYRFPMTTGE